jgi:hypothetical protein
MGKYKQSTKAEVEKRIDLVYELLVLKRYRKSEILRFISENEGWRVSQRQVENYISAATERLKKLSMKTREEWLKETKERIEDIYAMAYNKGSISECRMILETENRILGYEDLPPIVELKTGDFINITTLLTEKEKAELLWKFQKKTGCADSKS